ncbi:MAG TPA: DUF427 domain-containing protein [Acidimicrobiales bacterium]|nr:DUF427 domain-containing protein [Acidimicrobiales bacterium]
MPLPQSFVEATERRIRVRLADEVVADTQRALLLVQYGPGALPTYYIPASDVRPGVLVDEARAPDGRRRWSVVCKRARADAAAWTHENPTGDFAPLEGHVTFSWRTLEWFEEDEQVHVHARDPHKRVDTLRSSRHVQVLLKGELVAESRRPVLLFETYLPVRYYLPFADVRTDLFIASDLVTRCPYKGTARYWSASIDSEVIPDVAWSYPDPIPENPKIKDLVCFFNERVTLVVDGAEAARPDTPWARSARGFSAD